LYAKGCLSELKALSAPPEDVKTLGRAMLLLSGETKDFSWKNFA